MPSFRKSGNDICGICAAIVAEPPSFVASEETWEFVIAPQESNVTKVHHWSPKTAEKRALMGLTISEITDITFLSLNRHRLLNLLKELLIRLKIPPAAL